MSWLDMSELYVDASPVHWTQRFTPHCSSIKTKAYMQVTLIF
jgi:hypothetical protein